MNKESAHITGRYAIIVALIGLIGLLGVAILEKKPGSDSEPESLPIDEIGEDENINNTTNTDTFMSSEQKNTIKNEPVAVEKKSTKPTRPLSSDNAGGVQINLNGNSKVENIVTGDSNIIKSNNR